MNSRIFGSNGIVRAARRQGEFAANLSKRRVWYAPDGDQDGQDSDGGSGSGTQTDQTDKHGDWFKSLPPEAQREIEELRNENKTSRRKLREQEDAQRKADEKRLQEQQEWQKLAEQRAQRLQELEPLQERFTQLETTVKESNLKRIAAIPEAFRSLVPSNYDPLALRDWLDANAAHFGSRPAPQMGQGAAGDGDQMPVPKLTDAERAMAARFGLTEKDVLESKKLQRPS